MTEEEQKIEEKQSTAEATPQVESLDEEVELDEVIGDESDTLESKCASLLSGHAKQKSLAKAAEQKISTYKPPEVKHNASKRTHGQLPEVIDMLKTIGIAYLCGPSGTGKSTIAKQACTELFQLGDKDPIASGKYAQISFSPDTTSGEMLGRTDVNGHFNESKIVQVFRDGGVILFDEIDDADPSMLIKVNTALANGYLAIPTGMVEKNPNTYIICAANTYGTGPDAMYVGRTRLDAATLDRFCLSTIYVDYDRKLEEEIASELPDTDKYWLLGFTHQVRQAIREGKMRRTCSTRFVINATKHLLSGKGVKWVRDHFTLGWNRSELAKVDAAQDDANEYTKKLRDLSVQDASGKSYKKSGNGYAFF